MHICITGPQWVDERQPLSHWGQDNMATVLKFKSKYNSFHSRKWIWKWHLTFYLNISVFMWPSPHDWHSVWQIHLTNTMNLMNWLVVLCLWPVVQLVPASVQSMWYSQDRFSTGLCCSLGVLTRTIFVLTIKLGWSCLFPMKFTLPTCLDMYTYIQDGNEAPIAALVRLAHGWIQLGSHFGDDFNMHFLVCFFFQVCWYFLILKVQVSGY